MSIDTLNLQCRLATIGEDLEDIVFLHIKAFPRFFLTLMGTAFVREYYRTVLDFPENIVLVAIQNNQTVGFVAGFGNPQAFYCFYRKRRFYLFPLIVWAIFRNPPLLKRVILNLKRVASVQGKSSEVELASIGVDPKARKIGIGQLLMQSFFQFSNQRGYETVYLTTDAKENERINQFYLKQGFNLERTFWSGNRQMNLYRTELKAIVSN